MILLRDLISIDPNSICPSPIIDEAHINCIWDKDFIKYYHQESWAQFYDCVVTDICPSEWDGLLDIYVK